MEEGRAETAAHSSKSILLFGRDRERELVGELLGAARTSRSGAIVLRGEPGVGKSALLLDARERAGDMCVLAARGVESESELPFAALFQFLRPALEHLEQLPAPQASALRRALGLEERRAEERFLVFAACLSLLSELAEERPVLCLVDDAHWLDAASADALLFAARRLDAAGIAMLFAAREGEVREFDAADIPSLMLGGLDEEAAASLIASTAGEVDPFVRDWLISQTHGNALALVELPSALSPAQLSGHEPIPQTLPLTRQVDAVFLERVRRLPDDAQRALLVGAADDTENAALVTRAARLLGASPHALDLAEQARLVQIRGSRLEFRHPLVRSAIYESAASCDRRAAHRALAESLADDEELADRRAWHLAASTLEPDEDVVSALEDAAERAESRAGYEAAAKAFARAAEFTSDGRARGRRLTRAARAARIAGADTYAVALASEARPLVEDALLRADLALTVGVAEYRRGRPMDALPGMLEAARSIAGIDPVKAVELLISAASSASMGGDRTARAEVSTLAAELASAGGDEEAMSVAKVLAASVQAREGDSPVGTAQLEDAFARASASEDPRHLYALSVAAIFMGENERFAALINRATSLARARGELGILAEALSMSAAQHYLAQRFDEAVLVAEEALQFARELGAANSTGTPLGILAFIAAIRGDEDQALRRSAEMRDLAAAHGLPARATFAELVVAMLEFGRGRWLEALEHFRIVADPRSDVGDGFLAKGAQPDMIEAALRAGFPDEARHALGEFEAWAPNSSYLWAGARLRSCRGLMEDGDEATAHFEEAMQLGATIGSFDLARIRLLYGEHLRRERHRADSRVQLRAALDAFERLQAEPWAERARGELRASGETARKRDPSTVDVLTPQELQIARFVAEGLSNKEVAAQLFLSPRTIDYHLRNVFAKLQIKSRTQLARLSLDEQRLAEVDEVSRETAIAG